MCMPGDNVEMTIELIHPIAMEQGLTFAIREGGRTVGSDVLLPLSSNQQKIQQFRTPGESSRESFFLVYLE